MMKKILCYYSFHKWYFTHCDRDEKWQWTTQHYKCEYCPATKTKPYNANEDWHKC